MTADKIHTGDHVLITARWQMVTKVEHFVKDPNYPKHSRWVRIHVEGRAEPFELPSDYPVDIDRGDGEEDLA
jgi:hypothetical protein